MGKVPMGSWGGAETCELVGGYMISLIGKKHGSNIGLYRDDGKVHLRQALTR